MITETEVQQLRSRINELEDRLKMLYRHLNLDYNSDPGSDPILNPKIQDALGKGNLIEAIKVYRELTGVGLAEAKAAVERLARR
jgi:hypothetical protein